MAESARVVFCQWFRFPLSLFELWLKARQLWHSTGSRGTEREGEWEYNRLPTRLPSQHSGPCPSIVVCRFSLSNQRKVLVNFSLTLLLTVSLHNVTTHNVTHWVIHFLFRSLSLSLSPLGCSSPEKCRTLLFTTKKIIIMTKLNWPSRNVIHCIFLALFTLNEFSILEQFCDNCLPPTTCFISFSIVCLHVWCETSIIGKILENFCKNWLSILWSIFSKLKFSKIWFNFTIIVEWIQRMQIKLSYFGTGLFEMGSPAHLMTDLYWNSREFVRKSGQNRPEEGRERGESLSHNAFPSLYRERYARCTDKGTLHSDMHFVAFCTAKGATFGSAFFCTFYCRVSCGIRLGKSCWNGFETLNDGILKKFFHFHQRVPRSDRMVKKWRKSDKYI